VIASFPTPLPSIEVTAARGEFVSTRVSSGTPVDLVLRLETIQGAIYGSFPTGQVCFDVGGDASNPDIALPIGTGIRVAADPDSLAIECKGGAVNDNGTPDTPDDDFVDFNPPAEQICFPIGFPQGGTN